MVKTVKAKEKKQDRVKIGVSIDDNLWRRLRALALIKKTNTGELLDAAIEGYLKGHE
jgi:hypothetical protein